MQINLSIDTANFAKCDIAILESVAQILGNGETTPMRPLYSAQVPAAESAQKQKVSTPTPPVAEQPRVTPQQQAPANNPTPSASGADMESARRAIKGAFDRNDDNKGLMRQKYIALGGSKLSDIDPQHYATLIDYANSL